MSNATVLGEMLAVAMGVRELRDDMPVTLDSLDLVDLAMEVEDMFSITIPNEALTELQTVGDVFRVLGKLIDFREP